MDAPARWVPANAARRIEKLAAEGWSVRGIAHVLGTDAGTFRRWLKDHPALQEAFENGRERERYALHNALYKAAMNGNAPAAMFLLKARHGYREGDQSDLANRVQLTFNLPGALKPEQYVQRLQPAADANPEPQRLPAAGT